MGLNERDVFLAMSGRTRQLWAEQFLGLEHSLDERRAWESYQWLHEQARLYFAEKFPGALDAEKWSDASAVEYRHQIIQALDGGKEVIGARIPVGDGEVRIAFLRPREDLLDVFVLRSLPFPAGRSASELAQLGSLKAGAVEDFLRPWAFVINRISVFTPSCHPGNQPFQVVFSPGDEIDYERERFWLAKQASKETLSNPLVAPEEGRYFATLDNGLLSETDRLKGASLLHHSSFQSVCECITQWTPTVSGFLAAKGLEAFICEVQRTRPDRYVFARALEIHGVAPEPACEHVGLPVFISVAWIAGQNVRTAHLTLEDIVTNHPKLQEVKDLTDSKGGCRTLFIGKETSVNAGYALLSDQEAAHPFTDFDPEGKLCRVPDAFVDTVYANPALIASHNSLEEAARLFCLEPPPERGEEIAPSVLCSIANAMLEKRSCPSQRALLSAAAAYCRWEAVTALGVACEIRARQSLASGALRNHSRDVPGLLPWVAIETNRLERHRQGKIAGLTDEAGFGTPLLEGVSFGTTV